MSLLKNSLKTLVLAGGMLLSSGELKAQQKVQQQKDSLTHVLEAQKRQANILQSLRAKSVYDQNTEVSYVFDKVPTDLETIGVASRNKIFYAEPGKLLIGGDKSVFLGLIHMGYKPQKIANEVYEITISGNIVEVKNRLSGLLKNANVLYKYFGYTSACPSFNDPQIYPQVTNGRQGWIMDDEWIFNGITNPTTHDIDSVYSWKIMHTPSTPASPNVVINIFDGGFDPNNTDFAGRVIWRWNITNNSVNTTVTDHGTSVAALAAASTNNGYGGVGMYDGPIRLYQISSNGISFPVTNLYIALDSLIQHCQQYPNQRQINNFSFSAGNDPLVLSRIQWLYNSNGGKQNFNQAATGNAGAGALDWPARRPECTARGATNTTNSKPIWVSSNTGPEMLDHGYVNDGQNVWAMQGNASFLSINGTSFSTPLGTGTVAWLVSQDTSRNHADVNALLDEGAKDLGVAGPDNIYGKGWARTGVSLKNAVVRHVPNSFDAATTPTYNFVPKYYNKHNITTGTRNEKIYINGSTTGITPTTYNGQNQAEFLLSFVTTNGFVNGVNTIKYEFTTPDGCTSWAYKQFTLSNVTTPTLPPIPDIRNVDPIECQSNPTQTGKLMNPPVSPATIQIVQDGATNLPFNWGDSTFSYPVGGPGAHNIRVTYQNAAGQRLKDTAYNVNAAITPAATAPSASVANICSGQNSTLTANYTNMGANPTFQWYRNNTLIPGATNATYNYTNATAGTQAFHVIITPTVGGCYTNASAVTSPVTNVNVQALPNTTSQTLTQPTCAIPSGSATINNLGSGNTWKVDNGPWVSTPSITGLAPGSHNAYQQSTLGCVSPASPFTINTVTGCTPVITQAVNTMSTPTVAGSTYQWYLNGNPIAGATSNTFTSMFAGTFTVVVTTGGTPYTSAPYNFVPSIAVTPSNYRVQETDVVCRGDNNGKIIVNTQQNLSYVMTTTGPNGYNNTTPFVGTTAQLSNLPAGTYQVCFSIAGIPAASYTQCFNTIINEPKDLAVLNRVVQGGQGTAIELQLSGGTNYFINLNGVDYQTRDSVITLMLQQGQNTIKITTDQSCQGTFEKVIYVGDQNKLNIFPNPVSNRATVHIPGVDQKVLIQIIGGTGAALYRQEALLGADRLAQIPTANLPSGVYYLHVRSSSYTGTVKFIKQ